MLLHEVGGAGGTAGRGLGNDVDATLAVCRTTGCSALAPFTLDVQTVVLFLTRPLKTSNFLNQLGRVRTRRTAILGLTHDDGRAALDAETALCAALPVLTPFHFAVDGHGAWGKLTFDPSDQGLWGWACQTAVTRFTNDDVHLCSVSNTASRAALRV